MPSFIFKSIGAFFVCVKIRGFSIFPCMDRQKIAEKVTIIASERWIKIKYKKIPRADY